MAQQRLMMAPVMRSLRELSLTFWFSLPSVYRYPICAQTDQMDGVSDSVPPSGVSK